MLHFPDSFNGKFIVVGRFQDRVAEILHNASLEEKIRIRKQVPFDLVYSIPVMPEVHVLAQSPDRN